jgi:Zn-dependent alcohol dehydrogenase
MPDGTSRFRRQADDPSLGCSTFSNYGIARIAVAKIAKTAVRSATSAAASTGIGAVISTAKVEAGANVVVFGLGGIG